MDQPTTPTPTPEVNPAWAQGAARLAARPAPPAPTTKPRAGGRPPSPDREAARAAAEAEEAKALAAQRETTTKVLVKPVAQIVATSSVLISKRIPEAALTKEEIGTFSLLISAVAAKYLPGLSERWREELELATYTAGLVLEKAMLVQERRATETREAKHLRAVPKPRPPYDPVL